jgi:microcystin-dependent protein
MANTKASSSQTFTKRFLCPGLIMPLPGSSLPAGWLLCDGSEISQSVYSVLFSLISTTYDTQYNPVTGSNWSAPSSGNFRIPDYRGLLLRGTGTPSGLDTVTLGGFQAQKTAQNGLSLSETSHHHHLPAGNFLVADVFNFNWTGDRGGWNRSSVSTSSVTHVTLGGDTETRPLNRGVNFIIKY